MSYCRFRNTLSDLRDCYYNMDGKLEDEEKEARANLIKLCQNITNEYGEPNEDDEDENN